MTQPPEHTDHSLHSSLREGMLEHLFVGGIMRELWLRGVRDFDVLHPITDAAGYDIVLSAGGAIRHVQLKSSALTAKTSRQGINTALAKQPSGCVVWMRFDADTLALGPFGWFGGLLAQALPDLGNRVGKHTKGNAEGIKAERKSIRVLNKGDFSWVETTSQIADLLFGPSMK
ncbi:MAG: group I intron-associated PD-(D/E)XK endonuclease [Rhodobacteraceae bacterium]|nr:group I intron-associated PD-(D/E)XK endonuclease [Paracoccaceae bacterium]